MSLQLIIRQIKILGNIITPSEQLNLHFQEKQNLLLRQVHYQNPQNQFPQSNFNQSKQLPQKKFRMEFGPQHHISKQCGYYVSPNQMFFEEPMTFIYDNNNHAYLMTIQIFQEHKYGDNSDIQKILNAQIDMSDLSNLHGDYLQSNLYNFSGKIIGKIIVTIEVFRRTFKYMQKVVSAVFFQKVKQEKQNKLLTANKNIKNLLINNHITNSIMTINSLHLIFQQQQTQAYGKQCFIMIKYGPLIKTFSKVAKPFSKENVSWMEYHEFMKNDDFKFVFYFFHYDQWNNIVCKAMGQIKYIVFDQTINNHSISMFDKRSNKYGNLMIKFQQKERQNVKLQYKLDKKIKQQQQKINSAIQQYMKAKFQAKYNNAVLSQKLRQMQLKRLQQQDQKNRPLNQQQKKQKQIQAKFVEFLQKQVIKIQRELMRRQKVNKQIQKKQKFLPIIHARQREERSRSPSGTQRSNKDKQDLSNPSSRYGYKFMNNLSSNNLKTKKKVSLGNANIMSQSFTMGDLIRKEPVKLPKI